ncbi:MAG: SCO family protein [Gammaproteobacteria bacterium]|nr:SCO family protein [Gammaproteobacteria bacterium]MDC0064625.1 SCO family protein [Gammaproteobacteria bacterium]MDC0223174.1 SCO family protein [Gammaproteobacteria bacterium]MDC0225736.1 SCO family protein [Gammaproteobacteria bacterium]|tara:strand:- start:1244 stop:1864 length:621 start_codon:yes stop_codon:yes gene_type:complete
MSRRNIIFVFLVLFGMSVLFAYFQSLPSLLQKKPTLLTGKILTRPMELDNFELIDQNNQTFNSESLKGNWTILFFGYTNCPDVCPTTIYKLAEVKNDVNQNLPSKNFNTVLVTLDPDRDTPERLDEYIGYFDESMLGVTGTYKNIQSFSSNLSVFYQRINKDGGYDFNHTASIFVFNQDGSLFATMSPATSVSELRDDFYTILNNF